jgi:hypothetical protein
MLQSWYQDIARSNVRRVCYPTSKLFGGRMKPNMRKLLNKRVKEINKVRKEAREADVPSSYDDYMFGRLMEVKYLLKELKEEKPLLTKK